MNPVARALAHPYAADALDRPPWDAAARSRRLDGLRHWRLTDNFTLEGSGVDEWGRRWWYEVDLERCLTSAPTLDWIAQVGGKTWCTAEVLGELVRALDVVLDLQGTLCGCAMAGGSGRRLTRSQVRARCRRLMEASQ